MAILLELSFFICIFVMNLKKGEIIMAKKVGQGINLDVNGSFIMSITDMLGQSVEEDIEQGILDNLEQGEYIISFDSKTIMDINNLFEAIYKFTLEIKDYTEYNFSEFEE